MINGDLQTGDKAFQLVIIVIMIGGAWLGLGFCLSGLLDHMLLIVVDSICFVVTASIAVNAALREYLKDWSKEDTL